MRQLSGGDNCFLNDVVNYRSVSCGLIVPTYISRTRFSWRHLFISSDRSCGDADRAPDAAAAAAYASLRSKLELYNTDWHRDELSCESISIASIFFRKATAAVEHVSNLNNVFANEQRSQHKCEKNSASQRFRKYKLKNIAVAKCWACLSSRGNAATSPYCRYPHPHTSIFNLR